MNLNKAKIYVILAEMKDSFGSLGEQCIKQHPFGTIYQSFFGKQT